MRVAAYSALFVTLDRSTEDDIIRRAPHDLGGCLVGVEIL
jgi:pyruvate-formate lyase